MAAPTMVHDQSTLFLMVIAAWISSVTMLVPWPPIMIALFEAHFPGEIAPWVVWGRWILNLAFIVGGALSTLLLLRGHRRALKYALGFSATYVAYWLSEYAFVHGTVLDVILAIERQWERGGLGSRIVILQHQVALPLIHLAFLACAGFYCYKRRYAI